MRQVPEQQRPNIGCALNHGSFTVNYSETDVENIEESPADLSLVSLLFHLLAGLQAIGTVLAIDYSAYVGALEINTSP